MNKMLVLLSLFLTQMTWSLEAPLYPEDGSMPMNFWYYSGGTTGPRMAPETIKEIEAAFRSEGVEPVVFKNYAWMQDILFFNQRGDFVSLANLPANEEYFDDVTMGIFESYGSWGDLTRISSEEFSSYEKNIDRLNLTFLEGGATITGKFSNGDDYLIAYQKRLDNLSRAYRDIFNAEASEDEVKAYIAKELKIKVENLFFLDYKTGTQHLDLFMKALPNGVLLLDEPSASLEVAKKYLPANSKVLKNIEAYFEPGRYSYQKRRDQNAANRVKLQLAERFKIISVPGRFYQYYTNHYGVTTAQEVINFFNGVSGVNKSGESFYITNKAENAQGLERFWTEFLGELDFKKKNIHFPGEYSNGAGLDCMGSPSL
jgi:hypothetical protein